MGIGGRMRQHRHLLAVVALSVASAGCFWTAPGAGPGRASHNVFETAITPATVGHLVELWAASGDGTGMGEPVTSDVAIHAADSAGAYALSPATGDRLWEQLVVPESPMIMGQPVADGPRVVLGYGFGNLGGRWTTEVRDAQTGAIVSSVGGGLVDGLRGRTLLTRLFAFGSGTPVLTAIRVTNLDIPGSGWSANLTFQSGGPSSGPLTLGTDHVFQAGAGPNLPTGATANGIRAFAVATAPANCPPPAPQGFACPVWSTPLPGTTATSPVLDPDESRLYVGSAGTLHAVEADTGSIVWTAPIDADVTSPPALADGVLYVPTGDGDLLVLDAATGATLWTAPTGSRIATQPAVAGGVVFTGSDDGTVRAFDAAGCGAAVCAYPLWSAGTGAGAVTGSPAVSQGRVYVGTADGRVVAYGLED